jgi:hypothetical protein
VPIPLSGAIYYEGASETPENLALMELTDRLGRDPVEVTG